MAAGNAGLGPFLSLSDRALNARVIRLFVSRMGRSVESGGVLRVADALGVHRLSCRHIRTGKGAPRLLSALSPRLSPRASAVRVMTQSRSFIQEFAAQRGRRHSDLDVHAAALGLDTAVLAQSWSTLSGATTLPPHENHAPPARPSTVRMLRILIPPATQAGRRSGARLQLQWRLGQQFCFWTSRRPP